MQEKTNLKTIEEYKELCSKFMSEFCTRGHKNLYKDKKLYKKARIKASLPDKRAVITVSLFILIVLLSIVLLTLSLNFSLTMDGWVRALGFLTGCATIYVADKISEEVGLTIGKDKESKTLEYYLKNEFNKKESEFLVSHLMNMKWEEVKEFVSIKKDIHREMFVKIELYAILESFKDSFDEVQEA